MSFLPMEADTVNPATTHDNAEAALLGDLTTYETFEELIGPDLTSKFCDLYGGRTVMIPGRAVEGHWLVAAIGIEAAETIVRHYRVGRQGARIRVPKGERHRSLNRIADVARMTDEGLSAGDIAMALNVTERTVFRVRRLVAKRRASRLKGRINKLLQTGMDIAGIANAVFLPLQSVQAIMKHMETEVPVGSKSVEQEDSQ